MNSRAGTMVRPSSESRMTAERVISRISPSNDSTATRLPHAVALAHVVCGDDVARDAARADAERDCGAAEQHRGRYRDHVDQQGDVDTELTGDDDDCKDEDERPRQAPEQAGAGQSGRARRPGHRAGGQAACHVHREQDHGPHEQQRQVEQDLGEDVGEPRQGEQLGHRREEEHDHQPVDGVGENSRDRPAKLDLRLAEPIAHRVEHAVDSGAHPDDRRPQRNCEHPAEPRTGGRRRRGRARRRRPFPPAPGRCCRGRRARCRRSLAGASRSMRVPYAVPRGCRGRGRPPSRARRNTAWAGRTARRPSR